MLSYFFLQLRQGPWKEERFPGFGVFLCTENKELYTLSEEKNRTNIIEGFDFDVTCHLVFCTKLLSIVAC